jgi:hypothetical protein
MIYCLIVYTLLTFNRIYFSFVIVFSVHRWVLTQRNQSQYVFEHRYDQACLYDIVV